MAVAACDSRRQPMGGKSRGRPGAASTRPLVQGSQTTKNNSTREWWEGAHATCCQRSPGTASRGHTTRGGNAEGRGQSPRTRAPSKRVNQPRKAGNPARKTCPSPKQTRATDKRGPRRRGRPSAFSYPKMLRFSGRRKGRCHAENSAATAGKEGPPPLRADGGPEKHPTWARTPPGAYGRGYLWPGACARIIASAATSARGPLARAARRPPGAARAAAPAGNFAAARQRAAETGPADAGIRA